MSGQLYGRSFVILLCLGILLASALYAMGRIQKVRRLEAAVHDAQRANSTLSSQLGTGGAPAREGPKTRAAEPTAPLPPPSAAKADSPLAELRRWLGNHPEKSIPEISLVPEDFAKTVAATIRPGSEADLRQGARMLRTRARQIFGERATAALAKFAADHAGTLPSLLSDLAADLGESIDESMLRRYQILAHGLYAETDAKAPLIGEIAGVDDDFDSVLSVSRTGLSKVTGDRTGTEMQRALHRYLAMQGGKAPADPAALAPYLTFPINSEVVARYIINRDYHVSEKK